MTNAVIVGAGVCGPVAAMALQRSGIEATVYEAHPLTTADVGSYLTVASNGLDALRAIGADAGVTAAGFPTSHTVLLSGTGKRLATVAIGRTGPGATVSHTVKRSLLHRALYDEASRRGVRFEFGKRLVAVEESRGGVLARFDDGSDASGHVLIGCDGVHSAVRQMVDAGAPAPRYVGLLNFGGYTPGVAAGEAGKWQMIFGRRAFFGYAADQAGGTAWFANVPRAPSTVVERASTSADQWKQWLIDLFADDRGPAAELIGNSILQLAADNTHDLPSVPRWHQGRTIIIGDAAHAPSPSSGQGASMAMEDAVVLAQCLRGASSHGDAFAVFEGIRRSRVEKIVAQGARSSSTKAVGPAGRLFRDLLLPVALRLFVTERSMAWMYDHHIDWMRPVNQGAVG